jgi:hypothetical protein
MVPGVVACVLAFTGEVSHAQVTWPVRSPEMDVFLRQTEGNSPRDCAAMADDQRRRTERRPITEVDVYRGMGDAFGAMVAMRWAAFVPTLGMHLERGSHSPGLVISWPASIPIGPVTACRIAPISGGLHEFHALRLVIEPALVVRRPLSVFLRPGLRAIWHRSSWRVGFGGGIGSTLAWIDGERVAASISPELSLHLGRCCHPGYILINARVDRYYPRREPDTALVNIGFVFW